MSRIWSARLRGATAALVGAVLLVPHAGAPAPASAAVPAGESGTSSVAAATYGPRSGTGCSDDGVSGKRVQAIYVVSSDRPDRYSQVVGTLRSALAEVDSTFVASSLRNGIPNGGTSRQVRWVHDGACLPTIAKAVVPPQRDAGGAVVRRVDGFNYADTVKLLTELGTVDGVDLNSLERKYLLLVDSDAATSNSFCGYGNFSLDSRAGQDNPNNLGRTYARIDALCWPGTLDPQTYAKHSAVAHELMHTLGAVLPDAPNAAGSHCTDNADNLCYADGAVSESDMRSVCPVADEWLFDCGGDDYFNTKPSGGYLTTNWNTANSAFLYTPPAPAVTQSVAPFVPGLPTAWAVSPSVTSGQGYNVKYAITSSSGVDPTTPCLLDRTSSLSGTDAGATVLCPAAATSVTLTPTVTQEDGRKVSAPSLRVWQSGQPRPAAVTMTPSAATVEVGDTVAVTAKVTDPASGQPLYGVPVQLTGDGLSARLLTDRTGLVRTTFTAARSTGVTARTEDAGLWQSATASGQVRAMVPTGLNIDTPEQFALEGSTVTLTGQLLDADGAPIAGQPVALWRNAGTWQQVATAASGTDGAVAIGTTIADSARYQLRFAGAGDYLPADSGEVSISATRTTTLAGSVSAAAVADGDPVDITARLADRTGGLPGEIIDLWFHDGQDWSLLEQDQTGPDGSVTFSTVPPGNGTFQLRFDATGTHTASTSAELAVAVRARTTLSLTGASTAPAGETVTLTAALAQSGTAVPGQPVTLWDVTDPAAPAAVATGSTADGGAATFTVTAAAARTYQARYAGDDVRAPATSGGRTVTGTYATALTTTAAETALGYGATTTIRGVLTSPGVGALAGETVELWGSAPDGSPARLATATTDSAGTATFTVTPSAATAYFVAYPGRGQFTPSAAPAVTVTVTRATAAALTGPATAGYGTATAVTAALTWAGTTTGVAGQPVELWTAPATGTAARAATATTDSAGKATFTLTLTASGSYQVRYAGRAFAGVSAQPATSPTAALTVVRPVAGTVTVPTKVAYGAAGTVTGKLLWAGTSTALTGQPVELWAHTGSWAKVATGTTGTAGTAAWTVKPLKRTAYRVVYAGRPVGAVTAGSVTSDHAYAAVVRATTARAVVSSSRVTYGSYATVTGSVTWAGTSTTLAGQPVELWGYARGAWTRVATGTTSSSGAIAWRVRPLLSTTYQVRYAGNRLVADVTTGAANSAGATTKVLSKVSLKTPTLVRYYNTHTITGSVSPATSGRLVSLVVDGRVKAKTYTDRYGKYTFRYKFPRGYRYVKTYVATSSYSDGAYSATYKVRSY